jgi:hypothetical protein
MKRRVVNRRVNNKGEVRVTNDVEDHHTATGSNQGACDCLHRDQNRNFVDTILQATQQLGMDMHQRGTRRRVQGNRRQRSYIFISLGLESDPNLPRLCLITRQQDGVKSLPASPCVSNCSNSLNQSQLLIDSETWKRHEVNDSEDLNCN